MNKAEISEWLLRTAKTIRAGRQAEVDVRDTLKQFGVHVRFEISDARSGALGQSKDGEWYVVARGRSNAVHRFTAAHELGHYLLIKHCDFSPTIKDKKNYFFCEDLCNQFAARLLVDHDEVALFKLVSARQCLVHVRYLANRYNVSAEVAARAIIETHSGVGVCAFSQDGNGLRVRTWGLSSLHGLSPRYNAKRVRSSSIKEEMGCWIRSVLGTEVNIADLDFASEFTERGMSKAKPIRGNSDSLQPPIASATSRLKPIGLAAIVTKNHR